MTDHLKRSKVWLSFTKKDSNTAKCNTCSKDIACKGGSTSNMITHLCQHAVNLIECAVLDVLKRQSPSLAAANVNASSTSNVSRSGSRQYTFAMYIQQKMSFKVFFQYCIFFLDASSERSQSSPPPTVNSARQRPPPLVVKLCSHLPCRGR